MKKCPDTRQYCNRFPNRLKQHSFLGAIVTMTGVSILLSACGSSSNTTSPQGAANVKSPTTTAKPLALTATLASWQLSAPLSRMVLLPSGSNFLAILGGLTAADTSASGVFRLNLSNGSLSAIGNLPTGVHDAGGAVIGGKLFVFGGGAVNTVSSVEAVSSTGGAGTVVANLPQPRSDLSAITVAGKTYIVGGYNGSVADGTVLSTSDGMTYRTLTSLKVPVRYAALASSGSTIYVFGGVAVGGANAGDPVSTIQEINIATGTTHVVGNLPIPLEGAAAFAINGHVYVAGGDTGTQSKLVSTGAIYEYLGKSRMKVVAVLPEPVSNAGVASSGGSVWLVGGENNGKTLSVVQTVSVK